MNSIRLLILTAMPSELSAVVTAMRDLTTERWGQIDVHAGSIGGSDVLALATGVGKVRASAGAQYAIDRFKPSLVLVLGSAGALDLKLTRGQVIVGGQIVEHDFDMTALAADPSNGRRAWATGTVLSEQVAAAVARVIGRENVRIGTVLTGDQVVTDAELRDRLRHHFGAACIEMEGAAVAAVCNQNEVPFVLVRVVSDSADRFAAQQFIRHLPSVSALSRDLVREVLRTDIGLSRDAVPKLVPMPYAGGARQISLGLPPGSPLQ
jgi:adenosylhomocysteine nucleosidase